MMSCVYALCFGQGADTQVPSFPIGYTSPFKLHNLDNNKFARSIQEQIQPSAPTPASPILTLVEAINKANQVAIANTVNKTQEEIDSEHWGSLCDSKQNKVMSQIGN
jgi:hypothetical protein